MYFNNGTQLIFGDPPAYPAADVDLATVVWGEISAGGGSGDIVVFDDDTSWVVAAAIVYDPEGYPQVPFHPELRFLPNDGTAENMSQSFEVSVYGFEAGWRCGFQTTHCTWL
jgi:hypothetical protein